MRNALGCYIQNAGTLETINDKLAYRVYELSEWLNHDRDALVKIVTLTTFFGIRSDFASVTAFSIISSQ